MQQINIAINHCCFFSGYTNCRLKIHQNLRSRNINSSDSPSRLLWPCARTPVSLPVKCVSLRQ